MTEKSPDVIYTRDVDYLDEDKPIRGQNYVCISFISPEDVLANKEVYYIGKFLKNFSKDMDVMLNALKTKYPQDEELINGIRESQQYIFDEADLQEQFRFFKDVNSSELDKEFREMNDFRTSMRGIKIRGTFDTLKEAQNRADFLKKGGDKFDIFVGQVGVWCPWSPNPNDLEDVQYAEAQLNTLMAKYKDNASQKDIFFEQRKNEKIEDARIKLEKAKLEKAQQQVSSLEDTDPWLKRKETETSASPDVSNVSDENTAGPSGSAASSEE
jgi:hypothetical protein